MEKVRGKFSRLLLKWFDQHRRDLPWRSRPGQTPDAYRVLVSEAMLQQTQVATVVPYFARFMEAFPTIQALADAEEQAVLRLWQGLGYYSRARNLHRSAKLICEKHGGVVPDQLSQLLDLPGVGRYTAGAIASIAYDVPAPILDGNVTRVLTRLHAIKEDPRDRETIARLWQIAEESIPSKRAGDFNQALMELGAKVCTPKSPACDACPIRKLCKAASLGLQNAIPRPRPATAQKTERRAILIIRGKGNRFLIEQRPATGRWARMWQFRTTTDAPPPRSQHKGSIRHVLTHRKYQFDVYETTAVSKSPDDRWATLDEIDQLPLPKPHVTVARFLRDGSPLR